MEPPAERPTAGNAVGSPLPRPLGAAWAVGLLPAVIYGGAIDGLVGVVVGLAGWTLLCVVILGIRRWVELRRTRHVTDEEALFAQLRPAPCPLCAAPTLLEACLDCTEGPSSHGRRRHDGSSWEEPDDPVGW